MSHEQVIAWRPLGELLVERGLLPTEELDAALAEQTQTGDRLGAILVARKAITGVMLTTLLAEQAGVPLETQTGFGSGLFTKLAERHALDERPAPAVPATKAGQEPGPSDPVTDPDDPAYELAALRVEVEMLRLRNEQLEAELAAKRQPRRRSSKSAA